MLPTVRPLVLHALAQGVHENTRDAAFGALAGHDPLARLLARRQLNKSLARAQTLTSLDDEAQRCRIAACVVQKKLPEADYDDPVALAAEVEPILSAIVAPAKKPWLTIGTLVVAISAVVLPAGWWILSRPFDPLSSDAGQLLGKGVPNFVITLLNDEGDAHQEARADVTDTKARAALGEPAVKELEGVLDAAVALRRAPATADFGKLSAAYSSAAAGFNQELQTKKQPFFLDADVWTVNSRVTPVLLSFYIERESRATVGDTSVRAIHLWRLDQMNLHQSYLGYTRRDTPAALVLLDQIESRLVQLVLPALADGESMWIVDEEARLKAQPWAVELGKRAADMVRRHHLQESDAGFDEATKEGLKRVGTLLARRRTLIMSWRKDMAKHRRRLRVPTRLIPRGEYSDDLHLFVPTKELNEWDDLHGDLLETDNLRAFVAIRDLYADSTERHEIQHRLDYERDGGLPMPALIAKRLGVKPEEEVSPRGKAGRARDELSAYLSSIAQSSQAPLVGLTLLQVFVFDMNESGGAYSYAALAAIEGIAGELGIDVDKILGQRRVGRQQVAKLLYEVAKHPPAALRKAAAAYYETAFGQPLPEVSIKSVADNPRWRH